MIALSSASGGCVVGRHAHGSANDAFAASAADPETYAKDKDHCWQAAESDADIGDSDVDADSVGAAIGAAIGQGFKFERRRNEAYSACMMRLGYWKKK